jgi:alpha-glucosidase
MPEPLLAFIRGDGADSALCVFNLGAHKVEWKLPEGWTPVEMLNVSAVAAANSLPGLAAMVARPK